MTLDHPNICKFNECYIDTETVYLVMEYVKGKNFEDMLEEIRGPELVYG